MNYYDIIFVVYMQGSSLIKLGFKSKKIIVDVRTGAVGTTEKKRKLNDLLMKFEVGTFQYKTIISQCLQKKFNLFQNNVYILPLGSDILSSTIKDYKEIKLLYIGTLNSRNIEDTVNGLSLFVQKYNDIPISYDIFGSGYLEVEAKLRNSIVEAKLEDIVTFHGRKPHSEIQEYFDNCNVGVSYIPITDYFDCQPPTKTYEYINSGMYCIATNTKANQNLISEKNGILCQDTAKSFSSALESFYKNKDYIDTQAISDTLSKYSWKIIVEKILKPLFQNIVKQ